MSNDHFTENLDYTASKGMGSAKNIYHPKYKEVPQDIKELVSNMDKKEMIKWVKIWRDLENLGILAFGDMPISKPIFIGTEVMRNYLKDDDIK